MAKRKASKKKKKSSLKNDPNAPELEDDRVFDGTDGPPIADGFQVGDSPSPLSGRPRGACITAALKRALAEATEEGVPFIQVLVEMARDKAVDGDFKFFKEIYDRIEGKVPDSIQAKTQSEHVIIRKGETTPVKTKEEEN